jgi:hypothetical protein
VVEPVGLIIIEVIRWTGMRIPAGLRWSPRRVLGLAGPAFFDEGEEAFLAVVLG